MIAADAERDQRPAARVCASACRSPPAPLRPAAGRSTWFETVSQPQSPLSSCQRRWCLRTGSHCDYTRCRREPEDRHASGRAHRAPVEQVADHGDGSGARGDHRRSVVERDSADRDDRNRASQRATARDELEPDGVVTSVLRSRAENRTDGHVGDRLAQRRLDLRGRVRGEPDDCVSRRAVVAPRDGGDRPGRRARPPRATCARGQARR